MLVITRGIDWKLFFNNVSSSETHEWLFTQFLTMKAYNLIKYPTIS